MSISDEQFDQTLYNLQRMGMDVTVSEIRARDTAQRAALGAAIEGAMKWEQDLKDAREVLARVEAEKHTIECRFEVSEATLSCIRGCLRAAEGDIDQLKEQLAEALWHLDGVLNNLPEDMNNRFAGSRSFVARYAQAEQQEAQGAQAGDERAAFEEAWIKLYRIDVEKCPEFHPKTFRTGTSYQREVGGDYIGSAWWGWQARAALATQPATIKLPDRKRTDHLPAEYKTMTPTRASIESYNRALDDVAALNAVRGAEHE